MPRRKAWVAAIIILIVAGGSLYAYFASAPEPNPCLPLGGSSILRSRAQADTLGAITEYQLPGPSRETNGIALAPDGSVWFGEQAVPGFGHLLPDGNLTEYAWPSTASRTPGGACDFKTSIWGVALWNGMVWGADGDFNGIVGFNQTSGTTRVLNLTGSGGFPYTLTVGPDGALWFTLLSTPATIGRVSTDYGVSYYKLSGLGKFLTAELQFLGPSRAYVVAIDTLGGPGGLFSFDPTNISSVIVPSQAGPGLKLSSPTSLSIADGLVWVTQHGAASVASYNISSGIWKVYPTSTENYTVTTLPYFVRASGGQVWFNEHYANKIALIDTVTGVLTEFSEANPPVSNLSAIQNDLTIALAPVGLWFTSWTGNYIGFADASFNPGFSMGVTGSTVFSLTRGHSTTVLVSVTGSWTAPLEFKASDSETLTSVPSGIRLTPNSTTLPPGSRPQTLSVNLAIGDNVTAGNYTVALTLVDGLVSRSVYVSVTVASGNTT